MKELIVVFVLLLSALSCFSQIEFPTCPFDASRDRVVSLAVYRPHKVNSKTEIIIFSHGYDGSRNNESNQTYIYLTRFLSQKGFYVIDIQHELADDPLLAMEGNFMEARMPNWEKGVADILFTIREFKKLKPQLNWNDFVLIERPDGGDMTMLLAVRYPQSINKAISMDHRRMIISRIRSPRLYVLRGCNYDADSGVLPIGKEQEQFRMKVVELDGTTHNNMGGSGTEEQHNLINQYIYGFLTRR